MTILQLPWANIPHLTSQMPHPHTQVTVPSVSEIKELILHVVKDRSQLLSHVEDLHRVTEAAKRERVLAIEEKDQLLHR